MLSTTQMSKPTCHCRIGLQGSQIRGPGFVTPQNCLRDLRFAMIMIPFSAQSGSKVYPKGNRLQWRRVDSIVLQKVPLISQGCSDHLRFLCISCIYIYIFIYISVCLNLCKGHLRTSLIGTFSFQLQWIWEATPEGIGS